MPLDEERASKCEGKYNKQQASTGEELQPVLFAGNDTGSSLQMLLIFSFWVR